MCLVDGRARAIARTNAYSALAATRAAVERRVSESKGLGAAQKHLVAEAASRHAEAAMLQESAATRLIAVRSR